MFSLRIYFLRMCVYGSCVLNYKVGRYILSVEDVFVNLDIAGWGNKAGVITVCVYKLGNVWYV